MAKTKVVRGTCSVSGCGRPHKARGYCPAHLQRWMRGVEVAVPLRSRDMSHPDLCSENGCEQPVKAKGLCHTHYARLLRHGHTKYPDRKKPVKPCTYPGCQNHLYANGLCNQHYTRGRRLRDKYGLTAEAYAAILKAQGGVCAICKEPQSAVNGPSGKVTDFHVDHCHSTNRVRGLLCNQCNRGIGLFQDSPSLLRRAAAYLESHMTS